MCCGEGSGAPRLESIDETMLPMRSYEADEIDAVNALLGGQSGLALLPRSGKNRSSDATR